MCKALEITQYSRVEFVKDYWHQVFTGMLDAYRSGVTPNPDVVCNRSIKFGSLVKHLKRRYAHEYTNGGLLLVTGHYAAIGTLSPDAGQFLGLTDDEMQREREHTVLCTATDMTKDQTYFLAGVQRDILLPPPDAPLQIAFPLQHMRKSEVRELAKQQHLPNALRRESMGICFVGKRRKFREFLDEYIETSRGAIVEMPSGEVVGHHKGVHYYTVGQSARLSPHRMYVCRLDAELQQVLVVRDPHHHLMYSLSATLLEFNWLVSDTVARRVLALLRQHSDPNQQQEDGEMKPSRWSFVARCRHRQRHAPVRALTPFPNEKATASDSTTTTTAAAEAAAEAPVFPLPSLPTRLSIEFADPVHTVAPGQFCALYLYDRHARRATVCLGGGTLASTNSPSHPFSATVQARLWSAARKSSETQQLLQTKIHCENTL